MKQQSLRIVLCTTITILFMGCASNKQIILTNIEREVADNIFIDDNTLQIVSSVTADDIHEPIVLKRTRLCQMAEEQADEQLLKQYPKAKNISTKKEIYTTLYTQDGGCKKVVHYEAYGLKRNLS